MVIGTNVYLKDHINIIQYGNNTNRVNTHVFVIHSRSIFLFNNACAREVVCSDLSPVRDNPVRIGMYNSVSPDTIYMVNWFL